MWTIWAFLLASVVLLVVVVWATRSLRVARAALASLSARASAQAQQMCRLEKVAARNAAILQNAMDGFFVLGENYRFREVNESFCRMVGYRPDELTNMRITDLEVAQPLYRGSSPATLGTGLHHLTTAHRHKEGHIVQLESCVIVLREEAGRILVGFARDVTERTRAEDALRKSEKKYRDLVETSRDLIWALDAEGRWTFVNNAARAIYGYEPSEMLGRCFTEFMTPERAKQEWQVFEEIKEGSSAHRHDTTHLRRDGGEVRLSFNAIPVVDDYGNVIGATGTATDITEKERLESQLRKSQKLESLGVLAGGVAHDFNNLLVGVLGNASIALEQLPPESSARPYLQKVLNAGQRAAELTQRMLAYAGRAVCDVQRIDLNALVTELVELSHSTVPKNVAVRVRACQDVPAIEADSGQIQQVVMNLLINASEAIGAAGGRIEIRTSVESLESAQIAREFPGHALEPGRFVCLEVEDSGHGMPPETLARIFEPFFSTKFAGRGLGLAAILGIVKAHRGAIAVASTLGVGTRFRVLFPAAEARTTQADPAPGAAPAAPRGSTVLVIDDEEDIRDVVRDILESRGMRVLTASNGAEGVCVFKMRQDEIDAVLLDMNMPGLSGEAVFRELVSLRPDVKVLLSSGYTEQETAARFKHSRLAGFVHKPYTVNGLVEKIGAALVNAE